MKYKIGDYVLLDIDEIKINNVSERNWFLKRLYCSHNKLTKLPKLPLKLKELTCTQLNKII